MSSAQFSLFFGRCVLPPPTWISRQPRRQTQYLYPTVVWRHQKIHAYKKSTCRLYKIKIWRTENGHLPPPFGGAEIRQPIWQSDDKCRQSSEVMYISWQGCRGRSKKFRRNDHVHWWVSVDLKWSHFTISFLSQNARDNEIFPLWIGKPFSILRISVETRHHFPSVVTRTLSFHRMQHQDNLPNIFYCPLDVCTLHTSVEAISSWCGWVWFGVCHRWEKDLSTTKVFHHHGDIEIVEEPVYSSTC